MDTWVSLLFVILALAGAWKVVALRREAKQLRAEAAKPVPYEGGSTHGRQPTIGEQADAYRGKLRLQVRRGGLDASEVEPMVQEFIRKGSRNVP
jgi:hypothetical protein